MYNLKNKANKGILLEVSDLLRNQTKCWLSVCSNSTRLLKMHESAGLMQDKKQLLKFLLEYNPSVVNLLTTSSGEVCLTYERLRFALMLLDLDEDETLSVVLDLVHGLDLFDCYQQVYNSVGRKTGRGIFNPKLVLTPEIASKEVNCSIERLAEAVLGEPVVEDISYMLAELVKTDAGINLCDYLVADTFSTSVKIGVESCCLNELLDLAERDDMKQYLNPKLVKLVNSHRQRCMKQCENHSSGFFDTYRVSAIKRLVDKVCNERLLYQQDVAVDVQGFDFALVSETAIYIPTGEESRFLSDAIILKSPYCVDYQSELPLQWINSDFGYVGEYVDKMYVMQHKLTSRYNPVPFVFAVQTDKGYTLERKDYYNVCWLYDSYGVQYENYTGYLQPAFSFKDFLADEECFLEAEFVEKVKKLIVGDARYVKITANEVIKTIRVLCDCELCESTHSPDMINSIDEGEIEQLSDINDLVAYFI